MKARRPVLQPSLVALLALALSLLRPTAHGQTNSPAAPAQTAPPEVHLLFSGPGDIHDPWGQLHFGVTPVHKLRACPPADFTTIGTFHLPDGTWETFGQQLTEPTAGKTMADRLRTWKLIRAQSRDGVTLESEETVFTAESAAWTVQTAIAYNPEAKEYLLLRFKVDRGGFAYTPFFSGDGKHWHEEKAVFYDGDALSLFWSPALRRFVCVSKSLQPYPKHVVDHGGPTPSLGDPSLHDRRVLVFRSSPDGRRWEPSVSQEDIWNKDGRKSAVPLGFMTTPDAEDPPDLEFYSGNAFWYHDRAYMLVLNYAASPLLPHKHGPHLDNELWASPDGLRWERPARGVNALDGFPEIVRLETAPVLIDHQLVFVREPRAPNQLLGLPEDRISYVTARANGEFSTELLTMSAAELRLNAAVPAPDHPYAKAEAYVMAGVMDDNDKPIAGYEPDKCVIQKRDGSDIALNWNGQSARALAGRRIRLRFFLRSANIYGVTSSSATP